MILGNDYLEIRDLSSKFTDSEIAPHAEAIDRNA